MKRYFPTLAKKSKYKENDSKGEENWAGTINKDSSVIFSPKNLHEKMKLVRRLFRSASTGETTQQRLGKTHADTVYGHREAGPQQLSQWS